MKKFIFLLIILSPISNLFSMQTNISPKNIDFTTVFPEELSLEIFKIFLLDSKDLVEAMKQINKASCNKTWKRIILDPQLLKKTIKGLTTEEKNKSIIRNDAIGDFCLFVKYLKQFVKWYNPDNRDPGVANFYSGINTHYNLFIKIVENIKNGINSRFFNGNLKYMDFSNVDFNKMELIGTNFYKTNFTEANLRSALLQKTIFKKSNLSRADLYQANLQRADLESANLEYTNLDEADLSAANLRKANLKNAKVTLANLSESHFEGADIRGADFTNLRDGEILRIDQENPPDISMNRKTLYDKYTKADPCFMILLKEKATFVN